MKSPITMSLEELYSILRDDIKRYFKENNRSITLCRIIVEEGKKHGRVSSNNNPYQEQTRHKKELSKLCGWDAHEGKYDQKMFYLTMVYLTRSLGL
ncbi:hypothetical protein HYV49_02550 [Candidatus Pacearchaeota archaeon]|nr:hypothetical protein [Candidatus Pacearchaeota archaeon]